MNIQKTVILLALSIFCQEASALRIERLIMPGDLIQGHKKYEDACEKCHLNFAKEAQTRLCRECHEEVDLDIVRKQGFHGARVIRSRACTDCHTDHEGRKADIVIFDASVFDHEQTDFALKGGHKNLICKDCHKEGEKFREAAKECYGCHKGDDPHKELLGRECSDCHKEESWRKTEFDHDKTDFSLKDKHQDVSCESCHPGNISKKISQQCITCHRINDVHGGRYGKKCVACHVSRGWRKIAFDHDEETDFPLQYSHVRVSCDGCHSGNIYKDELQVDCHSCHEHNDAHRGQYGRQCEDCHKPSKWAKVSFDHDKTDFRLKGKHKEIKCNSCHRGHLYDEELQTNCFGCHSRDDVHKKKLGRMALI